MQLKSAKNAILYMRKQILKIFFRIKSLLRGLQYFSLKSMKLLIVLFKRIVSLLLSLWSLITKMHSNNRKKQRSEIGETTYYNLPVVKRELRTSN